MKALSIHPDYAMLIMMGKKTVECRTWKTDYRGDIVICSTAKKLSGTIPGHALCVVNLKDVVPFSRKHLKDACMKSTEYEAGMYAWILDDVRLIRPVPVKGKLSLWNYDQPIEFIPWDDNATKEHSDQMFDEIWEPLII